MNADHGFQFRAPWYVRARGGFGLRDPRALTPALQRYDTADLVDRLLADPSTAPALAGSGPHTLYQAHHDRFYAVVAELFCDVPGLPRAGSVTVEVGFVVSGSPRENRMYRLPPRDADCAAARTRSTWFGVVPTFPVDAVPHEIRCFARRGTSAWWSAPTETYTVVAFLDRDGDPDPVTPPPPVADPLC